MINGRKVWISKALESEKILLLTRTTDSLARLDAAELVLRKATWLYDQGKPCAVAGPLSARPITGAGPTSPTGLPTAAPAG